jgi:hypothetical protein
MVFFRFGQVEQPCLGLSGVFHIYIKKTINASNEMPMNIIYLEDRIALE